MDTIDTIKFSLIENMIKYLYFKTNYSIISYEWVICRGRTISVPIDCYLNRKRSELINFCRF